MAGPTRRQVLAAAAAAGVAVDPVAGEGTRSRTQPSPGDWPMYHHDAANTGHAPAAALPGGLEATWTAELADTRRLPVVAGGTVYAAAFTEGLYAVDAATGAREWHGLTDVSGTVATTPAVAGGTVYAGGSDYPVLAVDAATGDRRWAAEESALGSGMVTAPTVADGLVYAAHDGGRLFALDGATGERAWSVEVAESAQPGPPAVADGVVYFASGATQYALDAATGERLWTNDPDAHPASGFAVGGGRCYFLAQDELVAIDAKTTDRLWSYPVPGITFDPPTLVDGAVIVKGESHLSRLDGSTGAVQWTFREDLRPESREEWTEMEPDLYLEGPVAAADGRLYVLADDGATSLLALDAATGEVVDDHAVGDGASLSAPALAGGAAYFLTSDDELLAVRGAAAEGVGTGPSPTDSNRERPTAGADAAGPVADWLGGWTRLLAWLLGLPVVGALVLAVLVALSDRLGDGGSTSDDP